MGKKRRLNSAKAKFAAKRASHPRAKLLSQMATDPIEVEVSESLPLPEVENIVPRASLTPKATVKASTVTTKTAPKITKPKKTTKKATTRSRKVTNTTKPRAKSKKES